MLDRLFPTRKPKQLQIRQTRNTKQPHMINTCKGFVIDTGNEIKFTRDSRMATVYQDFDSADKFAKEHVVQFLPPWKQYFAVLISA